MSTPRELLNAAKAEIVEAEARHAIGRLLHSNESWS